MRRAGFTLLEVMIAVAIALGAIAVLVRGMVNDVTATNHIKQLTIATELVRSKMLDVEADLDVNGWGEDPEVIKDGDFTDDKFPDFHWREDIVKIQLPTAAQIQEATQKQAQQRLNSLSPGASQPASSPSGGGGGLLGGLLQGMPGMGGAGGAGAAGGAGMGALGPMGMILGQFDIFKGAIEHSIRKVTVKISWKEFGKDQSLSATEYIVDTKAVDAALMMSGAMSQPSGAPPQNNGTPAR